MKALTDIVLRHKRGEGVGVYSLCSAHPQVIEAAMHEARSSGTPLLIEATCNQVNQFGGYTGMTPVDFRAFVHAIADRVGLARERVWLGGDHLGPNVWQKEPAVSAMAKAEALVDQYVSAGFRKIHLDCSMACADDPTPVPEPTIAGRAARLARIAEAAWQRAGGEAPVYVIGTEVPIPGGAAEELEHLTVTTPESVEITLEAHRQAFADTASRSGYQYRDTFERVHNITVVQIGHGSANRVEGRWTKGRRPFGCSERHEFGKQKTRVRLDENRLAVVKQIAPADPRRNLSGARPRQFVGAQEEHREFLLPPAAYPVSVAELRRKFGGREAQDLIANGSVQLE